MHIQSKPVDESDSAPEDSSLSLGSEDVSASEEEDDRERFFLLFFFFSFLLFFSFLCLDDLDLFLSSPRQGQGYVLAIVAEFSPPRKDALDPT